MAALHQPGRAARARATDRPVIDPESFDCLCCGGGLHRMPVVIRYALDLLNGLVRFLDDGRVDLDTHAEVPLDRLRRVAPRGLWI